MLQKINILVLIVPLLLSSVHVQKAQADELSQLTNIVISEVQTGGLDENDLELPKAEFIELFNPTDTEIDISGWSLEFLSSSHDGTADPTRTIFVFDGLVAAEGYVLLSYAGYLPDADIYFGAGSTRPSGLLAKSGGHVRLVDDTGEIIDQVGWISAKQIGSWPRTSEIPPGYSIKRILPDDPLFDIGEIFTAPTQPTTPEGGGYILHESEEEEVIEEPQEEEDDTPEGLTCEGIIISELLPNPAGADTGKEFIELYNPTDEVIPLLGCSLQTTANNKIYAFLENVELQPEEYLAFYDSVTGLTLPNAAGGTVWLLSPTEELQAVSYVGDLEDDMAWALVDNEWTATYMPTPAVANIAMPFKPCPSGQERNPETNRCQNIAVLAAVSLIVCKEGQERNPETNRCRSVLGATPSLVPCKAGQERNPETNRCRNVGVAGAALKPCAEGQQRNPETNRCRKIGATADGQAIASVQDVDAGPLSDNPRMWLAGVAAVGAVGYGAFEWRRDVMNAIGKLRARLPRRSA